MQCLGCGRYTASETGAIGSVSKMKVTTLDQVTPGAVERIVTGGPWDAAWGGGIVPTSITLVGGAAGSGKTTLLLQIASITAKITGKKSYYLSAEQAPGELRLTADRFGIDNLDRFVVMREFGFGAEVDDEVFKLDPPGIIILDSISSLVGKDAHAAVVIAKRYKQYSSKHSAPSFLISHMTKEFDFAGLMALQHEVDTLVTLFPEEDGRRHLKAWKNRYGPTHAEFYLIMTETGLAEAPPKRASPRDFAEAAAAAGVPMPDAANDVEELAAGIEAANSRVEKTEKVLARAIQGVEKRLERELAKLDKRTRKLIERSPRAAAIEGEALRRGRTPMKKTAKRPATKRAVTRKAARRKPKASSGGGRG